ncbi:hypothetical protein SAMN05421754_10845 [Nitrosomonas sp. Nm58]|jgi:hypothetical protein|nr:hypothetical protein SAMN05421754_10845 [Nitrosomonas sp. Nm58]
MAGKTKRAALVWRRIKRRYWPATANWGRSPGDVATWTGYDNALAETINGLYKTEVIRHRGP